MKHLLILIGFCAMAFSYGYSIREPVKPEILHVYEGHTEYVPVNTCERVGKFRNNPHSYDMAQAIPAAALMRPRGR